MRRALTSTAIGLVLGTIALFLAGVLSWGYYSVSPSSRALSIAFSWPFLSAQFILPASAGASVAVLGFTFNYSFYILVSWLLLGFRRGRPSAA